MLTDEFLDYLTREAGYSAHTVAAYRTDLRMWADFATGGNPERLDPTDMTAADLRVWLASLSRDGMSAATVRRKVQSLRAFFKYLMRYHGLKSNPASLLTLARMPKRLPLYVRPEETERLLDGQSDDPESESDFTAARNRLILELLYDTGMRCSELTGLTDVNADTMKCELKVRGKRNKDRIIPISTGLAALIDSYRELREASPSTRQGESATAPLIVSRRGAPMNRRSVYSIVHNAMAEAGVHAERLSPHVMRHSFATDMLNAGADLNSVKQLLGHASLASTQIYTHISNRELQLNYQQAHPRALKKGGQNGNHD